MNHKKLQYKMIERDETPKTLSKSTGIQREYISRMRHEDKDIRVSTLKKLCKALKCKAEDLW